MTSVCAPSTDRQHLIGDGQQHLTIASTGVLKPAVEVDMVEAIVSFVISISDVLRRLIDYLYLASRASCCSRF